MLQQHSESLLIEDDAKFSDALEEFPFFDASSSFEFENPLPGSISSSVFNLDDNNRETVSNESNHTPESQSSLSSPGLRRRRRFSRQSSKELPRSRFKSTPDGLVDVDIHGSTIPMGKNYKFLRNLKDNEKSNDKSNRTKVRVSSVSVNKQLTEETNGNSFNNSVITSVSGDASISDGSVTVNSSNSGSNFLFTLAGLIIKAILIQTTLLVGFVTFPIWLMYSSYMFLIDPFAIMRRAKRYMMRTLSRSLGFFYGNVKSIVYLWIKRNKSTWKFCLQIGWGLLWLVFVGVILVGLLVFSFVISGAIMKCILEEPVERIDQLNFDYTRSAPMAFVPMTSCPEPLCLDCNEKIEFGNVAESRVIPLDHKLQATVLLTMPESDYNRNLGIFQVRVGFLARNGKPLWSTTQPCMLQFKSQLIGLLSTGLKLVPLITGYSSESQTLDIKFRGYTEREVPTSCLRVVLEPRAEFATVGGVPEIYTAYLKLESQLPFLKRFLWSWKATVFVWTGIVVFLVGLVFMVLCCTPLMVPWLRPTGASSNFRPTSR